MPRSSASKKQLDCCYFSLSIASRQLTYIQLYGVEGFFFYFIFLSFFYFLLKTKQNKTFHPSGFGGSDHSLWNKQIRKSARRGWNLWERERERNEAFFKYFYYFLIFQMASQQRGSDTDRSFQFEMCVSVGLPPPLLVCSTIYIIYKVATLKGWLSDCTLQLSNGSTSAAAVDVVYRFFEDNRRRPIISSTFGGPNIFTNCMSSKERRTRQQ